MCRFIVALRFLSLSITLFASSFYAESLFAESRYTAEVHLSGLSRLAASTAVSRIEPSRLENIAPIRLSARVIGVGKLRARFNQRWPKTWSSTFTTAGGQRSADTSRVELLRGDYSSSGRLSFRKQKVNSRIAASLHFTEGGEKLLTYFRVPRGKASHLYRLEVSLNEAPYSATVTRARDELALHCGLKTAAARVPAAGLNQLDVAPLASRNTELGTDADFEFFQLHGSDSNNVIAARINTVATLYSNNFGLEFQITAQNTFTTDDQPYLSTDPNSLLTQFSNYLNSSAALGWADLFHLFTAKEIDGSVVGLAAKGVVCSDLENRYAFSQDIGDTLSYIVTAHELGHNFDAGHDDASGPSIMNTILDPSGSDFSAPSIAEVSAYVESNSGCLGVAGEPVETPVLTGKRLRKRPGFVKLTLALVYDQGWQLIDEVELLFRKNKRKSFRALALGGQTSFQAGSQASNLTTNRIGQYQLRHISTGNVSKIVELRPNGTVKVIG